MILTIFETLVLGILWVLMQLAKLLMYFITAITKNVATFMISLVLITIIVIAASIALR